MQSVTGNSIKQVALPDSLHPVILHQDLCEEAFTQCLKEGLASYDDCIWVCDKEALAIVEKNWPKLANYIHSFCIFHRYSGEILKTQKVLFELYDFLIEEGAHRSTTIVALGGGALLDLAGFAAATYQRGIRYLNIPTTLLSMADAAMGGKTAINLPKAKNIIGSTHQPQTVLLWPKLLCQLPSNQWSSGMAEVIKHGLLDKKTFHRLSESPKLTCEDAVFTDILQASCQYKLTLVSKDPLDKEGMRVFLNLGHTFAHAIEALTQYSHYLHGEAVSIGLYLASRYSHIAYGFPGKEVEALKRLLTKYDLPTKLQAPLPIDRLIQMMKRDKKNASQNIHLVTLKALGEPFLEKKPNLEWIKTLWAEAGGYTS